jgi:uncharacterized membrane-anchored protein
MKKTSTLTVAIGIMLLMFLCAVVLAESGLDVAAPQAVEQSQEQSTDQNDTNAKAQPMSGNVSISKRNKAKLELEQQKKLKQEQINTEKAAEATKQ